ncbi:MAG: hypothetical protein ACOY94_24535 [Bacillota bacterium]
MRRIIGLLLCLILLAGCGAGAPARNEPPGLPAGLTIEQVALVRDGEGGLTDVARTLAGRPEIANKRKRWRELPRTDLVALNLTAEEERWLLHPPVQVGETPVYARANQQWEVEVVAGGEVVYTYRHPKALRMASPHHMVQGLTAWNGQWVLETVEAKVLVGGESLNERLGYPEIFGFRLIAGKPFFFFTQEGKVRLSYDGQVLPNHFDRVPHYGCCESTAYNPRGSEQMVSFFGLRDGQWYHVDLGVYD